MNDFNGIVVGVETLEHSRSAIEWAMREAAVRRLQVLLVHVVSPASTLPGSAGWPVVPAQDVQRAAEAHLNAAVTYAHRCEPAVSVAPMVCTSSPATALLDCGANARLLVVGTRQSSLLRSALVGSTGVQLAHSADAPFVVVRGTWDAPPDAPVVVGVDPADTSTRTLAAAFTYASVHDRPLQAVLCWEPDIYASEEREPADMARLRDSAETSLSKALSGWLTDFPEVTVVRRLVCDYPAAALVDASVDAALIIVGIGGSRVARTLGSTAATVLHHAECPVEIVPH